VATLAGKTYEVQVDHGGGRWVMVDVHETRKASIAQAQEFLESGKYGGVKVVAESERTGLETVFEEIIEGFDDRPVTIISITKAPVCINFGDFFELESRRTVGRVLRNYLERQGRSALELMYDAGQIRILENNASLFPQAIQQIASAQARGSDIKPSQRTDELYQAVEQVRKKALSVVNDDTGYQTLKTRGVDALIGEMNKAHEAEEALYFSRHAFARYFGDVGDWNKKIELLVGLAKEGISSSGVSILDEMFAEILDGVPAVRELLAGQPDAAVANRVLIMLCKGRVKAPPNALSCIEVFNNVLGRLDLPLTQNALLGHVADYVGGVRPLTKEGQDADRKAFSVMVRDLVDVAGVRGGPNMCGALTQRARLAFAGGDENLSFSDAMARIINLLPHRAARIGYLVELSLSGISREDKGIVLAGLSRTVKQLTSLAALVPSGSSPEATEAAVEGLKRHLTSNDVPQEWRDALTKTFDSLLAKPRSEKSAAKSTTVIITDEEFKAMVNEKPQQKEASIGEILFEEGDLGDEAYLVLEGEIEIFQRIGNTEHAVATLGKGEILGEMSLIDNQPRMASARVLDNTKLMVITQESLRMRLHRLQQEDRVMRRLLDVLVNRLRGDAQAGA